MRDEDDSSHVATGNPPSVEDLCAVRGRQGQLICNCAHNSTIVIEPSA
jgi:hypothetical protein